MSSRDGSTNGGGKLLKHTYDSARNTSMENDIESDKEEYKKEIILNIEVFKAAFKSINKSMEDSISKKELLTFLDNNMEKV